MSATTSTKETMSKSKKMTKQKIFTNELFSARQNIPDFIKNYKLFNEKVRHQKIFTKLGLSNFTAPCAMARPQVDLRRENFVTALITLMHSSLEKAKTEANIMLDKAQYLLDTADDLDMDAINEISVIASKVAAQIAPSNATYDRIIRLKDGKISLNLAEKIVKTVEKNDKGFNEKTVFGKDESLFSVMNKLKDMFTAQKIPFVDIAASNEYKTFSAENVTDKTYKVVFSADGSEGAWDLLTMSMRGVKSCQRWDGEYHRCLIGSILSKFVGIIYITSGADYQGYGPKMMRRSIVRYAIDAETNSPCILIDKVYPLPEGGELLEETLNIFKKAIAEKCKLPVHYAPTLAKRTPQFYAPFEGIRKQVSERDWSYQDTPLKSSIDFRLYSLLNYYDSDTSRHIEALKAKMIAHFSDKFRETLSQTKGPNPEISNFFTSLKMNGNFDRFNELLVKCICEKVLFNVPTRTPTNKSYRLYLRSFILQLNSIKASFKGGFISLVNQYSKGMSTEQLQTMIFDNILKPFLMEEFRILGV